jgi:large subunit ribosomal protein L22
MQVVAVAKSVRQSPRKVGLVASLVRGRSVEDAITILDHTPKRAALAIKKTIESAKANAENNHNMDGKSLMVTELDIGPASSMKRYRPVAHGRAQPYKLRSTNIRVVVEGKEKAKKKAAAKKEETKKTEDKKQDTADKKTTEKAPENKRTFSRNTPKANDPAVSTKRTGRRGDR